MANPLAMSKIIHYVNLFKGYRPAVHKLQLEHPVFKPSTEATVCGWWKPGHFTPSGMSGKGLCLLMKGSAFVRQARLAEMCTLHRKVCELKQAFMCRS